MDIHTLHIEHIEMLVLYTILTIVNARMHRGVSGIRWFIGYGLGVSAGALLIGFRGVIPDVVSIFFGDVLVSIGYVLLHRSMTEFFSRGAWHHRIQIGLAGFMALATAQFGFITPNTTHRLMAFSAILALQLTMTAVVVAKNTPSFMRAAGSAMAILLALLSLSNTVRLISLLFQDAPANYLRGGPMLAWTLLNNSVLQGAVIIAYVWMTAARLHHDLETQALTDPLTGLLNRRAIEMAAKRAILACERSLKPVSAILFDLDEFKRINDSFGHLCGDAVLVAVAGCLSRELRQQDLSARLGGDEFAVLLPETPIATALTIAERLRTAIAGIKVPHAGREISAHGSFGVAELRDPTQDWDILMATCDQALYRVKSKGGNLVST
jgi:diguanylate cyclase (GGDEF)-like protein